MSTSSPFVQLVDDHVVVLLAGEVDLTVRTTLTDSYDFAIALLEVPHLVVDVSRVTFMDSTGLSTLAAALKKINARGGTISVVGASARIVNLLHITHLDTLVTLLPAEAPRTKATAA